MNGKIKERGTSMRTLLLTKEKHMEVAECEIPSINEEEVLVKVVYTGICGSDVHTYHGLNAKVKYPLTMGHETSGEIVKIGQHCPDGLEIGDRITINPLLSCGACFLCKSGKEHLCRQRTFLGFTRNGAFAEYVNVHHSQVYKIGEHIPLDVASMIEPFAVGVHAINRSNLSLGDKIVILGGGTIGLMIALAARQAGAGFIAISEVSDYRLKKIREMNFTAIDGRTQDLQEEVLKMTAGVGADIVFEAAGVQTTSEQMTKILRPQGTAVIAGLYSQFPKVDSNDVNFRELTIKGTTIYTKEEFQYAIQALPVESLKKMISHRLPIERSLEGFELSGSAIDSMKVLIQL